MTPEKSIHINKLKKLYEGKLLQIERSTCGGSSLRNLVLTAEAAAISETLIGSESEASGL